VEMDRGLRTTENGQRTRSKMDPGKSSPPYLTLSRIERDEIMGTTVTQSGALGLGEASQARDENDDPGGGER
jgi:hypothetical protein